MVEIADSPSPQQADPVPHPTAKMPRLGEELPIFCERCGYSLHGLPQTKCEHCTIRQFHCPECGHHQPINTLRPAVQHVLGRVRAFALTGVVLFKVAVFFFVLFGWTGMGAAWTYEYIDSSSYVDKSGNYIETGPQRKPIRFADVDLERLVAFAIFAFTFGCVSRMLLLRFRRGPLVGLSVSVLVALALLLGASIEYWDSPDRQYKYEMPYRGGLFFLIGYTTVIMIIAATVVWPIWCGLVKAFLPKRAANALLAWQRSQSDPNATAHARSIFAREPLPHH